MVKSGVPFAIFLIILIPAVLILIPDSGGVVTSPSMDEGTYLEFSYSHRNIEGTTTRSGIMTASVTYALWNDFDCILLSGTIDGTYSTPEANGAETGTWREYYRMEDLALMNSFRVREIEQSGVKSVNRSESSYSPHYRWIKFPLDFLDGWEQEGLEKRSSWEVEMDGVPTLSGNRKEIFDLWMLCINDNSLYTVDVMAGSFDTYFIKEIIDNETDKDTYYSEEVGWWVQKDVWYQDGEERIRINHFELKEWGRNSPPTASDISDIRIKEDEEDSSIRLDDVFDDPDGDDLDYEVVGNGTLPVYLSSGTVRIVPRPDEYGSWTFNITASDNTHPPVPAQVNVTVDPVDDPFILEKNTIKPETGDADTEFEFSITITDVEGDIPVQATLHIGGDTKELTMEGGDISSGLILSYRGSLASGVHEYHYTLDGYRYPESGMYEGPVVRSKENEELSDGSVNYNEGGTYTEFNFTVVWIDPDGLYPDALFLVLDGLDYPMSYSSGNPVSGAEYAVETYLDPGNHSHHYEAKWGDNTIRYPPDEIPGPRVYKPVIIDYGSSIKEGEVYFHIILRYGLGDLPDDVTLLVDGEEYAPSDMEGDIESGANYSKSQDLEPGTHTYQFRVVFGTETLTTDLVYFEISEPDEDGNGNVDGNEDEDNDYSTIMIIVIIALFITLVVVVIIIFSKRRGSIQEVEYRGEDREEETSEKE